MSTIDPGNEDEMAAMIDGLGLDEVTEESVQSLDGRSLLTEYSAIGVTLSEIGEVREPKTRQGRDLHSRYYALKAELIRRGLI